MASNYSNIQDGTPEDTRFLVAFFRNLLLGERNELKNRYLHLGYDRLVGGAGVDVGNDVGISESGVASLRERIMREMEADPTTSMSRIASALGVSTRHVERLVAALKEDGFVQRTSAMRSGRWIVAR
ncbi:MAG: winged helix-turn-helix domain-containing protein [Eggerthellaceae bacterium]|nr:winged helix-turn-helix domain-containing protein [Eggerthellaceae bacterium]